MRLTDPEQLLVELGVSAPGEIDLEAIAFHVGALVRCRVLHGCEARIVGAKDRAIITVNQSGQRRRRRFSIAHELGHWHYHRGQCLACRIEENPSRTIGSLERTANTYAANLLLPPYLFGPLSRKHKNLSFESVRALADEFDASHTATAIRLVESDHTPAILICHGPSGREWFRRSPSVPERWFPKKELDPDSFAFDLLFGRDLDSETMRKMDASAWFDRDEAYRFEIWEQTLRVGPQQTLTLLVFDNEEMIEEQERTAYHSWRGRRS